MDVDWRFPFVTNLFPFIMGLSRIISNFTFSVETEKEPGQRTLHLVSCPFAR